MGRSGNPAGVPAWTAAIVVALVLFSAGALRIAAQTSPGACSLATPAEVGSVLGGAVTLMPGSIGTVMTCSGASPTGKAMLRLFKRTGDPAGEKEKAGIDAIKKMGAQVDVKTSGGITCMSMEPPANMAQMGFGTTCTVISKAPMYAVIEITATARKDMVPMDKLRALAEKMATRF